MTPNAAETLNSRVYFRRAIVGSSSGAPSFPSARLSFVGKPIVPSQGSPCGLAQ